MKASKKTIRITLEKTGETSYVIKNMTNAVMLDARWWSLKADLRVGNSLEEPEAIKLAEHERLEVKVIGA